MAKVLVTGATGFLGSWVTDALLEQGHQVRVLSRSIENVGDLKNLEVIQGDITDFESVERACQKQEAVFHLAGLIGYSRTMRDAMERVNVYGTQNIITAVKKNHVSRLIHLSSVAAIGASFKANEILTENSPYNLQALHLGYFETKKKAEDLVISACRSQDIDAVILNPTTIYGAGDAKKGSRKNQLKVARGELRFYPPGGVNVVAVEDVVDGILSAWKKGRTGERYILAGENLLIREVLQKIANLAHSREPDWVIPKPLLLFLGKVGDWAETHEKKFLVNSELAWSSCLYHWFDAKKAKNELNFQSRPADIAIQNSIQWSRSRGLI